jgi:hypothetical protein
MQPPGGGGLGGLMKLMAAGGAKQPGKLAMFAKSKKHKKSKLPPKFGQGERHADFGPMV